MPSAISTRYAKALADAVLAPASHTEPAQALTELRAFEQMVESSPELRNVLLSPAVPTVRKRAVIARLAPAVPLSTLVRNFLFVVIDRRRGGLLGDTSSRVIVTHCRVSIVCTDDEPGFRCHSRPCDNTDDGP